MNGSKHTHLRKGYKACNPIPFLLAAICLVGCLNADMPVNAAETGIRGTALWGPVKPGPSRLGQSDEAPLSATFIVLVDERQVAQFKSDKKGNFEVLLRDLHLGIELDRQLKLLDRLLDHVALEKHHAEIVLRTGVGWIDAPRERAEGGLVVFR